MGFQQAAAVIQPGSHAGIADTFDHGAQEVCTVPSSPSHWALSDALAHEDILHADPDARLH